MDDDAAIIADGLTKQYGDKKALDNFSLTVARGSVFGLLGPNGAGKTTAVRTLATLLRIESGSAKVAGFDVATAPQEVRRRIGLTGQNAAVDEILTGRDNLVIFGRLFHLGSKGARQRADQLLEQFDLTEAASKPVKQYSGGMRRRLDLAASLILAPAVLFLDEPTTGLDPRSRGDVWAAVRELVAGGTTVLLTTQYLDEADQLADKIAVIDTGRVIAQGTPSELKSALGADRLEIVPAESEDLAAVAALIGRAAGVEPEVDADRRQIVVPVADPLATVSAVTGALAAVPVAVQDIVLRRPTLDDVFLTLTGHRSEQEDAA